MGERNIYERGCMRAAEEWVEDNFIGVLTTVMTVTILQVVGLYSSLTSMQFLF